MKDVLSFRWALALAAEFEDWFCEDRKAPADGLLHMAFPIVGRSSERQVAMGRREAIWRRKRRLPNPLIQRVSV